MSEKIQKVLANHGLGSRREIEAWIRDQRVCVNGKTAQIGDRITADDVVSVDGRELDLSRRIETRVILYNKPEGEICSADDPEGRPSVYQKLPRLKTGKWISIGRLDLNTSGLLLFTNDGALANRLMHPRYAIEREYVVRVLGHATPEILETLRKGVMLEDGEARFDDIVDHKSNGANHWYYVLVKEGRNRLVRRLFESQDLKVNRLKRVRYGPIVLGSMPRSGCWRDLSRQELKALS